MSNLDASLKLKSTSGAVPKAPAKVADDDKGVEFPVMDTERTD